MKMKALAPPSNIKLFREPLGLLQILRLVFNMADLLQAPRGNGQMIIVVPGFATDDSSTFILRKYLNAVGYKAVGWGLGKNNGDVERILIDFKQAVQNETKRTNSPLILVGWSLGGYIAREIAREIPGMVSKVISFGSPVIGGPKYTAAARQFKKMGVDLDELEKEIQAREAIPIEVPVTAIYSRSDGIVAWQACIDYNNPRVVHHEVNSTHIGLGFSPDVFKIIASSLAKE